MTVAGVGVGSLPLAVTNKLVHHGIICILVTYQNHTTTGHGRNFPP